MSMIADAQCHTDSLATMELFQGLSATEVATVAAAARLRHLPKSQHIFSQGDDGVRAHVIIKGSVRIGQLGSDGAQIIIRLIGPGEMFGAAALFTDRRYPADAVTLAETLEASWSEPELLDFMTIYPSIAINVIRIIGKRLQEVQDRVREFATQSAERRVAHTVLRLARQAGHNTIDGTMIAFPLRRKDVADIAGTTLHTASRILIAWERAGLLLTHNQRLTLRQPTEILRIAEDGGD